MTFFSSSDWVSAFNYITFFSIFLFTDSKQRERVKVGLSNVNIVYDVYMPTKSLQSGISETRTVLTDGESDT